jgi:hypothetical protein
MLLRNLVLAAALAAPIQVALADGQSTSGHSGLALAALVASYSPTLSARDKAAMAEIFAGKGSGGFPKGQKIEIVADKIVCRAGDVDIAARSCVLSFGAKTVTIEGRASNELYATLIEAGVAGDGAAGTIYESLAKLACKVDPAEIAQNDGGGVSCAYGAP